MEWNYNEYQRELDEEGIIDFSHMLESDLPSDLECKPATEDTNVSDQPGDVSEFAQSAYDAAITEEGEETSDLVEVQLDSTNEEEWKPTPDSNKRRPKGPCDIFSPITKMFTGASDSPSGSDSTHGNPRKESLSPNRNRFEALSQDDDEDEEVIADAVTSTATVDDHFGPPDIVSSIMTRPSEEEVQETSSPTPQDESKKQDGQDFHEADLD